MTGYRAPTIGEAFIGPEDAPCVQAGPDAAETWFPGQGVVDAGEAGAACRRCPARLDCALFAIDNSITHGVWGGYLFSPNSIDQPAIRRLRRTRTTNRKGTP